MAISLTILNGTDSIAASRITINDNFSTISDSLNEILSIIDIATGRIDNWNFGSNPLIETGSIIVRGTTAAGGINILSGGLITQNGNVVIGGTTGNGYLELGFNSGVKIEKFTKPLTTGNIPAIDFSGSGGVTGITGSTGVIGYLTIPRQPTTIITTIQSPQLGALVFDTTDMKLKVCTGTSAGSTGTWTIVGTQS